TTVKIFLTSVMVLSTTACVFLGGNESATEFVAGKSGSLEVEVISEHDRPGESPQFIGTAYIPINALQTFTAEILFPADYMFDINGFLYAGPAGTTIGEYAIDINDDGSPELSFPVKSESMFFAWVDLNNNNVKEFSEPDIFQSQNINNEKTLNITIPDGGDNDPSINHGDVSFRMKITIYAGLLINPNIAQNNIITAIVQSVDPDTGGPNNGSGDDPTETIFAQELLIDLIFENHF
ncbi:MAG: hypothetical protein OQK49_02065, partial [Proteobacteria bacterium]|nr:hypothetical protein [Pseudomonadota bacterium]